jgi:hypothetical protein
MDENAIKDIAAAIHEADHGYAPYHGDADMGLAERLTRELYERGYAIVQIVTCM